VGYFSELVFIESTGKFAPGIKNGISFEEMSTPDLI
jgi:hypothetical protein